MGIALDTIARRKRVRTRHRDLEFHGNAFVIHYACESFHDIVEGQSPRIVSIAIRQLRDGQTRTFAINRLAEELQLAIDSGSMDRLEKELLRRFFDFVSKRSGAYWLHWNMRDSNYGFEAVAHRARVLKVKGVVDFDPQYLVDLAHDLKCLYGPRYAPHPRLESLLDLNDVDKRDFLTGEEEAAAYRQGKFVELHLSSLKKVHVIHAVFLLERSGKLRVKAKWWARASDPIAALGELSRDHPYWHLVLSVLAVLGLAISLLT